MFFNVLIRMKAIAIFLLFASLAPGQEALSYCNVGLTAATAVNTTCTTTCVILSTYSAGTITATAYSCGSSSTCPSAPALVSGSGQFYKCCTTDNCNTGTASVGTSLTCYKGESVTSSSSLSTGTSPANTTVCSTNFCQTASTYLSGKVTSTEYGCATGTNGTCATNTGTMATAGIVYSCCSTDKCNVGTADAYSTMKSPSTTFTTLATLVLVAIFRK